MLKKLSQWFTDEALSNAEPSSDEHALELATAALMMEVARSDPVSYTHLRAHETLR